MKKPNSYEAKKILVVRYGCENYDYIFDYLKKRFVGSKTIRPQKSPLFELTVTDKIDLPYPETKRSTKAATKTATYKQAGNSDYNFERQSLHKDLIERAKDYDLCVAILDVSVQGNKYGACLDTEQNENEEHGEKHFYLSLKEAGGILRENGISAVNFVVAGIYRQLIRHICFPTIMMKDDGDLRCIFTRSLYDRINDIKFATLFPILSRAAIKKIKSSGLEPDYAKFLYKTTKKELAYYKPVLYKRILCRLEIRPKTHILVGILIAIGTGIIGAGIFELIMCAFRC
ncbi:MAG: hypothetical protein FWC11_03895 [Firmicutes bacterium]|nr:hypothetical protein [Bacillota bacterium]